MVRRFVVHLPQRYGAVSCHALCWYNPIHPPHTFRALVLTQSDIVPLLRADPEGDRAADEVRDVFFADNRQYQHEGRYDADINMLADVLYQYFYEMTVDPMWRNFRGDGNRFILTEGWGDEAVDPTVTTIQTRVEHAIQFRNTDAALQASEGLELAIQRNPGLPIVRRGFGPRGYVDELVGNRDDIEVMLIGPTITM
jgi:hypothetical protein